MPPKKKPKPPSVPALLARLFAQQETCMENLDELHALVTTLAADVGRLSTTIAALETAVDQLSDETTTPAADTAEPA